MLRPVWNAPFQFILNSFQWLQSFSDVWFQNPSSFLLAKYITLWGTIGNCKIKKEKSSLNLRTLTWYDSADGLGKRSFYFYIYLQLKKVGFPRDDLDSPVLSRQWKQACDGFSWYNEQLYVADLPWSSKQVCADISGIFVPWGLSVQKQTKLPNVWKRTNQNKLKLLKQSVVVWINVLNWI